MSLQYLEQDCPLTLEEGLQEYFAGIEGLLTQDNASPEVARLFRYHDIGHVVFGCDTTLAGEPLADTWCVLGTNVTVRDYMRYFELPEAKAIFREAGFVKTCVASVLSLPNVVLAMWRCWRMVRKWPYWENDVWLDVPLEEIRRTFGIRVVRH